jgi:uncharacterized membrane protein YcjF (UPF0283 family)
MKDNFFWPGFILLAVALSGVISTAIAAAYQHYEWLGTTVLVTALATIAGGLWFLLEIRHVGILEEQWERAQEDQLRQGHARSS